MPGHDDIRIGTLVKAGPNCADYIRQILPHGFESVQLTFSLPLAGLELRGLADDLLRILDDDGRGAIVSSLGLYGNPLIDPETASGWATLVEAAGWFRTNLVCGFTGRIPNRPVPESIQLILQRLFGIELGGASLPVWQSYVDRVTGVLSGQV